MAVTKKIILLLLILPLCFTHGDVLVFKNGSRMEVQDLKIGPDRVTYTVNSMTATVPVRYIDLAATEKVNEELRAQQEEQRRLEAEKQQQEKEERAQTGTAIAPDGVPLGDLAGRSLTDQEIQKVLEKWMKRHETRTQLAGQKTGEPPPADWKGTYQLPFRSEAGVMMISAVVNDSVSTDFVFDTGASITAISTRLAYQASVPIDRSQSHIIQTANGATRCYIGELAVLQVGNLKLTNLPVLVVENCRENLLGQNVISKFTVTVDNSRNVIQLQKN